MVNHPNSAQPPGSNPPDNNSPSSSNNKSKAGEFHFKGEHKFLHMTFSADDWNKLMNLMARNVGDYITKTMQKMTEKLKQDWKRGAGEDPDS